jgi:hypothetical protein
MAVTSGFTQLRCGGVGGRCREHYSQHGRSDDEEGEMPTDAGSKAPRHANSEVSQRELIPLNTEASNHKKWSRGFGTSVLILTSTSFLRSSVGHIMSTSHQCSKEAGLTVRKFGGRRGGSTTQNWHSRTSLWGSHRAGSGRPATSVFSGPFVRSNDGPTSRASHGDLSISPWIGCNHAP